MRFRYLMLGLLIFVLTACDAIVVLLTSKKQATQSSSLLANQAEEQFWRILHEGRYQEIYDINRLLLAAYLQSPNDPQLAAHLGFLHIWKITERNREKTIQPIIVDEIILAKKYFSDAVILDPTDARYLGFWGDSQLVEGQIFQDEREKVRGYYTLQRAIHAWPQFNYFTAGYPMSSLPANSDYFKEALSWQWKTLDLCAGEEVDRDNPDFSRYMKFATQQGPQRACWNSWIAPFNFEGFFLNMGDMLVKNGDWQTAIKIYHNAQLEKNYSNWPYRALLEKRIQHAKENVSNFQEVNFISPEKTILFNSGYGCMACHQDK